MRVSRCKRVNKFFVQPIAPPCTTFYHMLWLTYPPLQQQWFHAINYGERYLRLTWFLFYHNRTTLLWILQANWSLIWGLKFYMNFGKCCRLFVAHRLILPDALLAKSSPIKRLFLVCFSDLPDGCTKEDLACYRLKECCR